MRKILLLAITILLSVKSHSSEALLPVDALMKAYNSSKLLLLGIPNHNSYQSYVYLMDFLEKVKNDESLKSIVLEGSKSLNGLYEELSVKPFSQVVGGDFLYQQRDISVLCNGSEWSWHLGRFLPFIRKINKNRDAKIKVSLIDSVDVFKEIKPIEGNLKAGSCKLENFYPLFVTSNNREIQTNANFERIYKSLNKEEKIIVVYHQAHLIPNFIYCRPSFKESDEGVTWTTDYGQLSWFGQFLNQHGVGNVDYSLVLIDEIDVDHNPRGAFKFTEHFKNKDRGEGVAWDLKYSVSPYESQTEHKMFNSEAFFLGYMDGRIQKTENIFETADFLIWSEYAQAKYSYADSSEYMPQMCNL